MNAAWPAAHAAWHAELDLGFAWTAFGTRLASRRHRGPLVVQRPLYPEGPEVCHAIVVHPPGGMAGGDVLDVRIDAAAGACALLTTPGAAKLYKGAGRSAAQAVHLRAHDRSCIEWLPQETIVFDAAEASLALDVDVAAEGLVIAWDIITLGRQAMGERFTCGRVRTHLRVRHDGQLVLEEVGEAAAGSRALDSPIGWRGQRAGGTFVAVGRTVEDSVRDAARAALADWPGTAAVSRPAAGLLVARFLGTSASEARSAFAALWKCIRPALNGRAAVAPRIWAT